uniref:Uncharacterized protein n=1 Tax=Candidozyma auris TaxID=498019 RepID=A0A0L0NUW1_CANAR
MAANWANGLRRSGWRMETRCWGVGFERAAWALVFGVFAVAALTSGWVFSRQPFGVGVGCPMR